MVFDPRATPPKSIPAPEQGRASARCEEDRHFPHVLLGFRGYHDHRERKRSVFSRHLFALGLVVDQGNGTFSIIGNNAYALPNSYNVTFEISDADGQPPIRKG
jgi:hypothetical protein